MALPNPPQNPNTPIPNNPFFAPLNPFVCGPYFPVAVSAGIDMTTGATVPELINDVGNVLAAGPGIALSTFLGTTTITATGGGGGSGTVTSITAGTGLTGGVITTSGTIALANTAVTAGAYTAADITIDAQGRITAAASGSVGGIPCSTITGKGALVTGTAASTPTALAVGTDGYVLTACAACTEGLTWIASSGAAPATPIVEGIVFGCTDGATTFNTALGYNALLAPTATGIANVAIGTSAGNAVTDGYGNTLIGPGTGCSVTTGTVNTAVGIGALCGVTSGSVNLGVGICSGCAYTTETGNAVFGGYFGDPGDTNALILSDGAGNLKAKFDSLGALSFDGASYGAIGEVLSSNGAGAKPTWIAGGGGGSGTVTSITAGTGLTGGTITTSGTIALANTAVTAGAYTAANITVDAQGRLTAASSGTAPVTAVTGTAPISVTSGLTPDVSIAAASTTAPGAVQLYNNTDSNSTTLALTAAQGKNLQEQITALAVTSNITLGGTYDANTGLVSSVTTQGTTAGLVVGSALPAPGVLNNEIFVIVDVQGTNGPNSPTLAHVGDWYLSDGTTWQFLNVGNQPAAATTTTAGVVCLSTDALAQAGTDATTALTPAAAASAYIPKACVTAKGALITGTAASTPTTLTVGTNGQALLACSTAPNGICWGTAGGSAATPTVAGIVFGCTFSSRTALGCNALLSNTIGDNNIAIGGNALQNNTTGSNNTANGRAALCSNTTGSFNTANGYHALYSNTTGNNNTANGQLALFANTTGSCNTANGVNALRANISGCLNVAVGICAGGTITTGCQNVVIGPNAQLVSATGSCQLAIGFSATSNWLTGDSTLAIKPGAGIIDCAASTGTAGQVLMSNGANAVCWGAAGGASAATPTVAGIVLGCTISTNTALGCNAAAVLAATALSNTVIGNCAGFALDDACCNTLVGTSAGCALNFGLGHTVIGTGAGAAITTGFYNVFVGAEAGASATQDRNVFIGACAGCAQTTGRSNVAIGDGVNVPITTGGCQLAIGYSSAFACWLTGNNTGAIKPGAGIIDCANSCGTVGQYLWTTGTNRIIWSASSPSDTRDKEVIGPVPTALPIVQQIEPITYRWKERESDVAQEEVIYGFSAQQLQEVDSVLVDDSDPDHLRIHDRKIVPLLVNAIQELSAKVEALEAKLASNG